MVASKSNIGHTLKLRVGATWAHLFKQNAKNKQPDEKLHTFMRKEFPDHYSREITTVEGVVSARRGYNKGVFTGKKIPAVQSVRYENGRPVEGRPRRSGSKSAGNGKKSGGKLRLKIGKGKTMASRKAA